MFRRHQPRDRGASRRAWWSVESGVPFSESDCTFWAHKKLNTLKFSLQVSAQRYVAKQTADCKHYDREEIDLYLVLTRENIKLTQCRGCKVWLEQILSSPQASETAEGGVKG